MHIHVRFFMIGSIVEPDTHRLSVIRVDLAEGRLPLQSCPRMRNGTRTGSGYLDAVHSSIEVTPERPNDWKLFAGSALLALPLGLA